MTALRTGSFKNITVYDSVGLLGVVFFLVAYTSLQFGLIIVRGLLYPAANGIAASLVMISLLDTLPLGVEGFWIAISAWSIVRIYIATQRAKFNEEEEELLVAKEIQRPKYLTRKLPDLGKWQNAPA